MFSKGSFFRVVKSWDCVVNSINDKILDWSKFNSSVGNNLYVPKMMIYVFDREENIVGKGENAGYQHFFLFPQSFQKLSFSGLMKVLIVW